MGNRSLAGYQPKKVWINDGSGDFVDVAQVVGATDRHDGRSVALADFGGRGALDVVVANQRGPLLLYKNQVSPERHWIAFELEGGCREDASREVVQQPQRDRRAGRALLERAAAGSGGVRRLRFLRTEPAAAALRPGPNRRRSCRDSLALRQDTGAEGPAQRTRAPHPGAGMTTRVRRGIRLYAAASALGGGSIGSTNAICPDPGDHRPAGWPADVRVPRELVRTVLAIATAIGVELILARLFSGKWPHLASAYISGISVGMLVAHLVWPYALCSAIAITSKYVLRWTAGISGILRTSPSWPCSCWPPIVSRA